MSDQPKKKDEPKIDLELRRAYPALALMKEAMERKEKDRESEDSRS